MAVAQAGDHAARSGGKWRASLLGRHLPHRARGGLCRGR